MLSFDFVILISGLCLAAFSVYLMVSIVLSNNSDSDALAWASGDEPAKSKSGLINASRPLVHNFTLQHAQRITNTNYRKNVHQTITKAGLVLELNVDEYIGLQIL